MIHHTPEGRHIKLGLNFSRSVGGFRLLWAWYNFATHEAVTYRLRLRFFGQPTFMWAVNRFNVIDAHLMRNDLALVHREVLEDLYAIESDMIRLSDQMTDIKPL